MREGVEKAESVERFIPKAHGAFYFFVCLHLHFRNTHCLPLPGPVAEHELRQEPLGRPQPRLTQSPWCWGCNDRLSSSLHPTHLADHRVSSEGRYIGLWWVRVPSLLCPHGPGSPPGLRGRLYLQGGRASSPEPRAPEITGQPRRCL